MELGYGILLEQKQILSQSQIQSLEILSMDGVELSHFLQNEYLENPMLEYKGEFQGGIEELGKQEPDAPGHQAGDLKSMEKTMKKI